MSDRRRFCNWLSTIFLWGSIIFIISAISTSSASTTIAVAIICMVTSGCIYFIAVFTSPYYFALLDIKSVRDIHVLLGNLYKEKPKIELAVECFKYEDEEADAENRKEEHFEGKVITHTASEEFGYQFCKDVSGDLVLDDLADQSNIHKVFVLLHIHTLIQYANDGTKEDKAEFLVRNKKETRYSYTENATIPGVIEHLMLRTTEKYGPDMVSLGWYLFFSILSFNTLYLHYLDCYITEQHYAVQKLVSSRRNSPSATETKKAAGPRIVTRGETVVYNLDTKRFAATKPERLPDILIKVRPAPPPQTATTMVQFTTTGNLQEGASALDANPANGMSGIGGLAGTSNVNAPLVPEVAEVGETYLRQVKVDIEVEGEKAVEKKESSMEGNIEDEDGESKKEEKKKANNEEQQDEAEIDDEDGDGNEVKKEEKAQEFSMSQPQPVEQQ